MPVICLRYRPLSLKHDSLIADSWPKIRTPGHDDGIKLDKEGDCPHQIARPAREDKGRSPDSRDKTVSARLQGRIQAVRGEWGEQIWVNGLEQRQH